MTTIISTAMTAASTIETAEKVSFCTKAKNFMKSHKTAFIVGGTAVAGVGAGVIIGVGAEKTKANGGVKATVNKLKKNKKEGEETSEEQSA